MVMIQWKRPIFLLVLIRLLLVFHVSQAQQAYVNNKQLDCYNHYNSTDGYDCNGATSSCLSYLTFRSNPPYYDSVATIGHLLGAEPSQIASINNLSSVAKIPKDTIVVVPVNCSCSSRYYQHNTTYTLKSHETYLLVANDTYQGLTTCQAMMAQNPSHDSRNLSEGLDLVAPLRCACPTANQSAAGVNYLLTFLVTFYDTISTIARMLGVVDEQSILDANQLSSDSLIFPFTTLLVPLHSMPTKIQTLLLSPPAPAPDSPIDESKSSSSKKWAYVGAGLGAAALLLIFAVFFFFFFFRRRQSRKESPIPVPPEKKLADQSADENKSWSISTPGIQYVIESLTVYPFEDLQKATCFFSEANRIKGSVYRGSFKGDDAAVKMMKGDVSSEISILKQINHSNIIRLSGFCVHEGNTYLIYEFVESGPLSDWLHLSKSDCLLGWKQRVQIAHDVGDALNYLHNYSNPPYVHKNLKTSNVLLDANLRGKVANFGLARSMDNQEEGGLQLTRHVVGTQGYLAPEYIENGVITPKLDVFAFGVVVLELLSGREAASPPSHRNGGGEEAEVLSASIKTVLEGENVREKLRGFVDPVMRQDYPLDLAFSLAQLASKCVAHDLNSRPTMSEVCVTLSKILSSSVDWDPSNELERSTSLSHDHDS